MTRSWQGMRERLGAKTTQRANHREMRRSQSADDTERRQPADEVGSRQQGNSQMGIVEQRHDIAFGHNTTL